MDDLKEKKKPHTSSSEVVAKKMMVVNGMAVGNNWEGEMAKIKVKRVFWFNGCIGIFSITLKSM